MKEKKNASFLVFMDLEKAYAEWTERPCVASIGDLWSGGQSFGWYKLSMNGVACVS